MPHLYNADAKVPVQEIGMNLGATGVSKVKKISTSI